MSDLGWAAAATLAGAGVAVWWYAGREERVPGRGVAAVLRGLAVALLLSGLRLPPLPARPGAGPGPAVLLDLSASMTLPARPGGPSRIDSARAVVAGLAPVVVLGFGVEPAALPLDSALAALPEAPASRLAPALASAAAGGARRAIVIGDGEWEDAAEAVETARRLGVAVEERRVAAPVARAGVRVVRAPPRAVAGDTLRLEAEIVAAGPAAGLPDSVEVVARRDGREVARARSAAPTPGRSVRVGLRLVPPAPEGEAAWHRYDVSLRAGDPYGAAPGASAWIEVTRGARGAVLVSLDPDWEPRFLLPVLESAAAGGARAYLRVADRYVRAGVDPGEVDPGTVLREARLATLLVVQASPAALPPELGRVLAARGRVLWLPRGTGRLAGTPVAVESVPAGDWYPAPGVRPSPIAGFLAGIEVGGLPPPGAPLELRGGVGWAPIEVRRDRQGPALPLLLAGGEGEGRWAVLGATGTWRWALREGAPRPAYRALFAGVAGWLLEAPGGRPVELEGENREPGRPLAWRVAPGVRDLAVSVYDSAGGLAWTDTLPDPPERLAGPVWEGGEGWFAASGRGPGGAFRIEAPIPAAAGAAERLPREAAPPLRLAGGGGRDGRDGRPPRRRPVWPFATAALLLCAEWAWRRRIGLR